MTNIKWELLYDYINTKCNPKTRETSYEASRLKAFKIKMLLEELSVMSNMHKRNPNKYTAPQCLRCKVEQEDNTHWLVCSKNHVNVKQLIKDETIKWITKRADREIAVLQGEKFIQKFLNTETNEQLKNTIISIIGIIKEEMYVESKLLVKKSKRPAICDLMHKITKSIYKKIWKERNEKTNSILAGIKTDPEPNTSRTRTITDIQQNEEMNISDAVVTKLDTWHKMY